MVCSVTLRQASVWVSIWVQCCVLECNLHICYLKMRRENVLHYTFCPQVGACYCYEVVLCLLHVLQLKRVRRAIWAAWFTAAVRRFSPAANISVSAWMGRLAACQPVPATYGCLLQTVPTHDASRSLASAARSGCATRSHKKTPSSQQWLVGQSASQIFFYFASLHWNSCSFFQSPKSFVIGSGGEGEHLLITYGPCEFPQFGSFSIPNFFFY